MKICSPLLMLTLSLHYLTVSVSAYQAAAVPWSESFVKNTQHLQIDKDFRVPMPVLNEPGVASNLIQVVTHHPQDKGLVQVALDNNDVYSEDENLKIYTLPLSRLKNVQVNAEGKTDVEWNTMMNSVRWISAGNRLNEEQKESTAYQAFIGAHHQLSYRIYDPKNGFRSFEWGGRKGSSVSTAFEKTALLDERNNVYLNNRVRFEVLGEKEQSGWTPLKYGKGDFQQVSMGRDYLYGIKMLNSTKFIAKYTVHNLDGENSRLNLDFAFPFGKIWSLEVSKEDGSLLAVTEHLNGNSGGHIYRSINQGQNWVKIDMQHLVGNNHRALIAKYAMPIDSDSFFCINDEGNLFIGTIQ
jgi:hypothetical protein